MHNELIADINSSLKIALPEQLSLEELREKLTAHINHLINHDFEKLVFYLYRIDINEAKMKQLLDQQNGEHAAELIAGLVIERQIQKNKSRREFRQRDNNISEEEKW
ncbi:MAG: hypothetical protein JNJ86_08710 [Chitinophagaceae bacterium]|nr:hypothetical protein [Chitinophagaceae bacterium]